MDQITYDLIKQADIMGPWVLEYDEREEYANEDTIEGILDSLKCPICLEIFDSPSRVRDCGHIFC